MTVALFELFAHVKLKTVLYSRNSGPFGKTLFFKNRLKPGMTKVSDSRGSSYKEIN